LPAGEAFRQFHTDFFANIAHALLRSPRTRQCLLLRYLSSSRKSAGQTPESGHFRLFYPREGQFRTEFSANIARVLLRSPGTPQCCSLRYLTSGRKSAGQTLESGHFRWVCPCKLQFCSDFSAKMGRALLCSSETHQGLPLRYLTRSRKSAVQMTKTGHFGLFSPHEEINLPVQAAHSAPIFLATWHTLCHSRAAVGNPRSK
jgi:hypothetical protein